MRQECAVWKRKEGEECSGVKECDSERVRRERGKQRKAEQEAGHIYKEC